MQRERKCQQLANPTRSAGNRLNCTLSMACIGFHRFLRLFPFTFHILLILLGNLKVYDAVQRLRLSGG